MSCVLYFPVQVLVASAWSTAFDWRHNYTSNLGNTACGMFKDLYVCSPLHALMNVTFVLVGLFTLVGGALFAACYRKHKAALVGFSLLALGGVGSMVVGLVPENIDFDLHSLGALLPFLLGNIGILVIGLSHFIVSKPLHTYTIVTGIIGVIAFVLFTISFYPLLGVGGMERLTDYAQILWLIIFGASTLRSLRHTENT